MLERMPPPTLETERLSLAILVPDDAEAVAQLLVENHHHLAGWFRWATLENATPDVQRARIEALAEESDVHYLMRTKADDEPIGILSGHARVGPGGVELGYWLSASAEGHGYVSEAVARMTRWFLGEGELVRVVIRARPDNARSLAVPRRLGFTREGILRLAYQADDEFWDSESWSMIRGEEPTIA